MDLASLVPMHGGGGGEECLVYTVNKLEVMQKGGVVPDWLSHTLICQVLEF